MTGDTQINTQTNTASGSRIRNFLIAMVAIVLSAALFIGLRTQTSTTTLAELDRQSTPYDIALTNGKPSLVEFYANWCTVCQKMVPDIATLEKEYGNKINFVMLNVDNTKWLPEMLRYRVDGIPHFVFLNQKGEALAETIGDQPRTIMASNLQALISGSSLPYAQNKGEISKFSAPVTTPNNQEDPRSHGNQVVNSVTSQ
ncbi:thioredoxin family protein [Calothrix sp. PCC 6303]|uniref:thioredoxin family protein n=1 Tax=Calothrix sp. PCC 6303 TaxID=1170562 RepID=UPI0002A03733|nr:thioredoxin family protein [Calothrix sp. PCC 6303]AFZ03668.1 Thioredoxin domain-containing protein [Calothrix sp. PCC 6303]